MSRPNGLVRPPSRKTPAAPIGSLVVRENGKSRFYPEGGLDRPAVGRGPGPRPPQRGDRASRPRVGSQQVYFNGLFGKQPPVDPYKAFDDVSVVSGGPAAPPVGPYRMATMRSIFLCMCISLVVFIVIAVAIIFPLIFVASTATGATVTGTVQLNTSFISAFNDTDSTEYIAQVTAFKIAMDQIFQASSVYSNTFRETTVTDLGAGPTSDTTEVSFTLNFNVGADDTPTLRNGIFAFVTSEISRAGSPVNALVVVQDTLSITDSCNVYCTTGTSLIISTCTCA